ncbi:MAG: hypothetical protein ACFB5Z_19375 [Elainellaceae cyanobacterium]
MADAKKIRQDLTALEAATEQLSGELNEAYREYLDVLAQSLRSQLVSACYSLCTQSYPDRFLKLTFDQREQIQQALQSTIAQACGQLSDPQKLLQATKQRRLEDARNGSEDAANHDSQRASEDTVVLKPRASAQSGLDLSLTIRAARVQGAPSPKDQNGALSEEGQGVIDATESSATESSAVEPSAVEPSNMESSAVESSAIETDSIDPDVEAEENEGLAIEMPDIEVQDTEAQDTEAQDIEAQIIESQYSESQGNDSKDRNTHDDAAIASPDARPDADPSQPKNAEHEPAEPQSPEPDDTICRPSNLIARQKRLETAVAEALEHLTDEINDRLRGAGILPQPLPEAMLEAVIKAGSAEVVEGPPNVFSLMMHTDEEEAKASPIMAIRLQVSELEFNDTRLSMKRSQLRNLHGQLRSLSRKYEKRQREWTVIEAESAWRAAWYEPS